MNQEDLQEWFDYRDGSLIWRKSPNAAVKEGRVAGSMKNGGYLHLTLRGCGCMVSRAVWIYHFGAIPDGIQVDHIDGDRLNNRIENLRLATKSQNMWNSSTQKISTTGIKGLVWRVDRNQWQCSIRHDGGVKTKIFRATHKDQAIAWLRQTRERLHGEFTNHGTRSVRGRWAVKLAAITIDELR